MAVSAIGSGGFKATQHAGHSISTMVVASAYGVVWRTPSEDARFGKAVASSADGQRLVAVEVFGHQLYTSALRTTVGEDGALLGVEGDSVWLMYAGGGTGSVVTYAGDLAIE